MRGDSPSGSANREMREERVECRHQELLFKILVNDLQSRVVVVHQHVVGKKECERHRMLAYY